MEDVITGTSIKTNYMRGTIFYFGVVTYEMEKYEYTSNNNNFVNSKTHAINSKIFSFYKKTFTQLPSVPTAAGVTLTNSKPLTSSLEYTVTIELHFPAIINLSEPLELLEPKIFNKRQACFLFGHCSLGNFHFHVACYVRDIAINKLDEL